MSFVIKIGKFYVIMLLRIFLVFERRKGRDGGGGDGGVFRNQTNCASGKWLYSGARKKKRTRVLVKKCFFC